MLRTGRFKQQILTEDFLATHAREISTCLQIEIDCYKNKQISAAELCAQAIFIYLSHLRKRNWLCPQPRSLIDNVKITSPIIEKINRSLLRGVPLSVNRTLLLWHLQQYPLILRFDIPQPREVFQMQCEGYRCVTLLYHENELKQLTPIGRDPFGFLLHDLIHADHFFRDQTIAQGQIGFSRLVEKSIQANCYLRYEDDPLFKKEFEYLISDMNSHPVHLVKTLRAVLLAAFKRFHNCPLGQPLSSQDEIKFQQDWWDILSAWQLSGTFCTPFERINNSNFSLQDDAPKIFEFCLHEGSAPTLNFFANNRYL